MRIFLLFFVISLFLFSCSKNESECVDAPDVAVTQPIKFEQLHNVLPSIQSKDELVKFLTDYPIIRQHILRREEYLDDSTFINTLYKRFTNPYIDTLLLETEKVFGEELTLKKEFEEAFARIKQYYPDIVVPKIQTIITGMDTDLYVSDTLIVVGLDFYLGKGSRFRPNMYEYMLRLYTPASIVPSVMLLYGIGGRINLTDPADKTVLADMIAYGKSYYFAKQMQPCVPDSILMGYSIKEINGSRSNQDLIWYRLVEDKVLYATSAMVKQRYLGDRPVTTEVGPECPGRIGQWIGWQIVKSYMKHHTDTTIPELMKMNNADKLFKESKYKAKS